MYAVQVRDTHRDKGASLGYEPLVLGHTTRSWSIVIAFDESLHQQAGAKLPEPHRSFRILESPRRSSEVVWVVRLRQVIHIHGLLLTDHSLACQPVKEVSGSVPGGTPESAPQSVRASSSLAKTWDLVTEIAMDADSPASSRRSLAASE